MTSARHGRRRPSIHMLETEAHDLDEACDIIVAERRAKKTRERMKGQKRTLSQEFASANFRAQIHKSLGKISLAGGMTSARTRRVAAKPLPHPFRDLPEDQKPIRARQMADSGFWGVGSPMVDRIAKEFAVGRGQVAEWLADEG